MNLRQKTLYAALLVSGSMLLAACNDDDPKSNNTPTAPVTQTESINGVAATGKAFVGQVEVVNAQGKKSEPVTVKADGTFSVNVPKGAPYLIRAFNNNAAETLYSYAVAAGYANVTQLTTAALYDANAKVDVAKLYADWAKQSTQLTAASVIQSAAEVVANLKSQMLAAGLTAAEVNTLNVFNYPFQPTSTNKFDNLLDQVKLNYNCTQMACDVNYVVNGQPFSWNYSINTSGIVINFDPKQNGGGIPTGNFNLKVTTTVSGLGAGTSATVNVPNIPKPANQNEFCTGQNTLSQLPNGYRLNSCSFNGNTGAVDATISQAGLTINYSVKYEYSPA